MNRYVRLASTIAVAWAVSTTAWTMCVSFLVAQDNPENTPVSTPFIKLMLFGGDKQHEYLGCLNCGERARDSVCNANSPYGSELHSISIWNRLGTYGNQLRQQSPWNELGGNPPVIVDQNGMIHGYFTKNRGDRQRTTIPVLTALLDRVGSDLRLVDAREFFCALD